MTDAERSTLVEVERARMGLTFALVAVSRNLEAAATGDVRALAMADCLRQIAATLHEVGDDMLVKLATVNELSQGLLAQLIAARIEQVGFALPLYADAKAFFAPLVEQVDLILHNARKCMH